MNPFLTALLILVTGVPFVALLVVVPRRLLSLQIGLIRAVVAAIVGAAVWLASGVLLSRDQQPSSALVTVQLGLALLVTMAFLAVAEAVVPSGSGLRVVNWRRMWRTKLGRSRRYAEIVAIALRNGLLSGSRRRRASSDAGEREALARSLRVALEGGRRHVYEARPAPFRPS